MAGVRARHWATTAVAVLLGAAAAGAEPLPVPGEGAPAVPWTDKAGRFFVDARVEDVRIDAAATVVTMALSPASGCPSSRYVYERDRPRWAAQTGRMVQAMRERALLRVSFGCHGGNQSINAVQFLAPAAGMQAAGLPRPVR